MERKKNWGERRGERRGPRIQSPSITDVNLPPKGGRLNGEETDEVTGSREDNKSCKGEGGRFCHRAGDANHDHREHRGVKGGKLDKTERRGTTPQGLGGVFKSRLRKRKSPINAKVVIRSGFLKKKKRRTRKKETRLWGRESRPGERGEKRDIYSPGKDSSGRVSRQTRRWRTENKKEEAGLRNSRKAMGLGSTLCKNWGRL